MLGLPASGRHYRDASSTHGVDLLQIAEPVEGGALWVCRTVGAMDGAIEPPWMGLRRVLQTHS
ncbi:hypothetical protein, partial [Stenotrophomonas sp. YIM B13575]|uniref:hypothetical protein n=1 Tax=Stenotrophomonas sp. YIM B13575 TaxID=3366314 RepID=UPI0036986965